MKTVFFFVTAFFFMACRGERYYYQHSLSAQDKTSLLKGDTVRTSFKGKTNAYRQYWKGQLVGFLENNKIKLHEAGQWLQYNPVDEEEIYALSLYDTSGQGILKQAEVYYDRAGTLLVNRVICGDTIVNRQKVLKCDYRWFYENGQLKSSYSTLSEDSVHVGAKMHGPDRTYDEKGNLLSEQRYEMGKKVKQ